MKNITREWLDKAENDFIVAGREIKEEFPVFDAICFHSQQCIEKYFKAILQENNIFFEKIHDLDILLEKCRSIIPELYKYKENIVELSSFAVEIRYPGIEATREDAENSFSISEKIRSIIRNYFRI